jgi:hypothetical protein
VAQEGRAKSGPPNDCFAPRSFRQKWLDDALRTQVDVMVRGAPNAYMPAAALATESELYDATTCVWARIRPCTQGSVSLPGTRFNSLTRKLGLQGPIAVDLRAVTVTAVIR